MHNTGIPSTPELSVVGDGGSITITVHYQYPGDVESLLFTLIIKNEADNVVVYNLSFGGEGIVTVTVALSPGMYSVETSGQNKYGLQPEIPSIEFQVTTPSSTEGAAECMYSIGQFI